MKTNKFISALVLILSAFFGCERAPNVTEPNTKHVPAIIARDIGDEGCFAHDVIWDWSVAAWRDNTTTPTRYYDQDPYYNCPNAVQGRAPDWGNEWGDGNGYLYWNFVDDIGDDIFGVVEYETSQCPFCGMMEIAQRVAENPAVQQRAIDLGEAVIGLGIRATLGWNFGGPISAQWHHIMTDKNTTRYPQWTTQFNNLIGSVGLSVATALNNLVRVYNHMGPHPQEYHEYIYSRLEEIINGGGGKAAVEEELRQLGVECSTSGTYCNSLITR
jgi:hypothetical protein